MKKRILPFTLIALLFCSTFSLNASASVDAGWEGVSFGLLINKYQKELTTIYFVNLGDALVDSMDISNDRDINDPQFRMVVSTNARLPVKINLTFKPFSLVSSSDARELAYDVRMFDVDGATPMAFSKGTSSTDRLSVSNSTTVSFSAQSSEDGAIWNYEYPFAFSFDQNGIADAEAGTYSCDLIAEVVLI